MNSGKDLYNPEVIPNTMKRNILFLLGIIILVFSTSAQETTCSSCEDCSVKLNGVYSVVKLDADITDHSGTCITFGASNVEFDCQGHTIDGSGTDYGIYSLGNSHLTIKNCNVMGYQMGMYVESASNITMTLNNASSNQWDGIYLKGVQDSTISYNALGSNDDGIYLDNSHGNTLDGNTIASNGYAGILLMGSNNNVLNSNQVCSNTESDIYVYSGSGNSGDENTCNNTIGWNDDGTTGCTYECGAVITTTTTTSTTTTISTSTTTSTTSSTTTTTLAGGETTCSSCDDCSAKLDGDYDVVKLTTEIFFHEGICIEFNANNVEFDCQGHLIEGSYYSVGLNDGVRIYEKSGNTVKNCVITDFDEGIYLYGSFNNTLTNNTVSNNSDGISFWRSSNNILTKNTASLNSGYGIHLDDSDYNTLTRNTASDNIYGIGVSESNYSTLTNNNASNNNYGIRLYHSYTNTLTNNIANSNTEYGIYLTDSSNNILDSNNICSNAKSDFYLKNSSGNSGDDNTCDNPDDWNDEGTTGCTYSCSAVTTTSTTTTIEGECPLKGDTQPCDGTVSDFELLAYINQWVQGSVSDFDLLEAIDNWASG